MALRVAMADALECLTCTCAGEWCASGPPHMRCR